MKHINLMSCKVNVVPIPQNIKHIIYPISHHDEIPLHRRKENNFLYLSSNKYFFEK